MIELIVRLAPLAVFGFMAWMVGTQGLDIIKTLTLLIACFMQLGFFALLISLFARLSPVPFYRKIGNTIPLAFSTSSSKATLAMAMHDVEHKLGVSKSTTNFVMPLDASMNMDGTAIYLGIYAVFFAQVFGVTLAPSDYLRG